MMEIQFCYDAISQSGSPFYFCLKKVSREKRDAIVAIAAFYQALENIILDQTDFQVSFNKLQWFRCDILKMDNQTPEHPISIVLQKVLPPDNRAALLEMMDGFAENFSFLPFHTFEEVVIYMMRTAGVRERLIARVLQYDEIIPVDIIYQCTLVLELTHYLQYLRHFVRRDFIYFPEDEMQRFHVSPEMLRAYKTTTEVVQLLEYQVEKIERSYAKMLSETTKSMKKNLAYLISRAEMSVALLQEIKSSGFCVLENFIQLTPLRMWWIAYRV